MPENILFVKNMVCHRCLLAVETVLTNASIKFDEIIAGQILVAQTLTQEQHESLARDLSAIGLELMDGKTSTLVERIKQLIIKKARQEVNEKEKSLNLSEYLSKNLYHEYTYLSSLFSSVEGRTIENYFIRQRIEKVKELLVYNEMTLTAIAFEMEYSSTAHLSHQFKQVTGLTPSHFKKVGSAKRKMIDLL